MDVKQLKKPNIFLLRASCLKETKRYWFLNGLLLGSRTLGHQYLLSWTHTTGCAAVCVCDERQRETREHFQLQEGKVCPIPGDSKSKLKWPF